MKYSLLSAALISGVLVAVTAGASFAQYPPPQGTVTCDRSVTVPITGSTIQVQATVADAAGRPLPNQVVQFAITSQPGSDARLSSNSALTGSSGVAAVGLYTGTTPGAITVSCAGPTASQFIAEVQGVASLPTTGNAGLQNTTAQRALPDWPLLVIGTALLTVAAGGLKCRSRRT